MGDDYRIVDRLNSKESTELLALHSICFPEVTLGEAEADFFHPEIAHVLLYRMRKLAGWAGIHSSRVVFEGKNIHLGGYGICTHPKMRRMGIADKLADLAMGKLSDMGCEVGFLSISMDHSAARALHEKHGFVLLPRPFSWENAHDELAQDMGGMIAPINSPQLYEYVLNGRDLLFVGKGYW